MKNTRLPFIYTTLIILIIYLLFLMKNNMKIKLNEMLWGKLKTFPSVTREFELNQIDDKHPNLPILFWWKIQRFKSSMFYRDESCALFPHIYDIQLKNFYWQILNTREETFQFFSAFYDTRSESEIDYVRVISRINNTQVKTILFCQLWFEDEFEPLIVRAGDFMHIWSKYWTINMDDTYNPYIITCPFKNPIGAKIPVAISIVENKCDNATNLLKIIYNRPSNKKQIAVCVKGLDYEQDISSRLIEWIEFMKLVGVDKVFMYEYQVHPNMRKVLDYYESHGDIDCKPLTLPFRQPNIPFLRHMFLKDNLAEQILNEIITLNDCFYRNIYSYKFEVILDIDEIILPINDYDWPSLLNRIISIAKKLNTSYASYNVRNVYFMDHMDPESPHLNIPSYMHMSQHVYRSRNFTEPFDYVKSFFDTQKVVGVHNHLPIAYVLGTTDTFNISTEYAHLHHYREDCHLDLWNCKDFLRKPVKDTIIWKYKYQLITRVMQVLKKTKLLV